MGGGGDNMWLLAKKKTGRRTSWRINLALFLTPYAQRCAPMVCATSFSHIGNIQHDLSKNPLSSPLSLASLLSPALLSPLSSLASGSIEWFRVASEGFGWFRMASSGFIWASNGFNGFCGPRPDFTPEGGGEWVARSRREGKRRV